MGRGCGTYRMRDEVTGICTGIVYTVCSSRAEPCRAMLDSLGGWHDMVIWKGVVGDLQLAESPSP